MLGRMESILRRLRHGISRSVWLARLLRLPVSEHSPGRPGLLMVQIDGLSQPQLQRALDSGEMPFLKRLIEREHYQLHAHYSGLPSTTPAVQAELFYGVKGAVPAFSFKEECSGQIVRMYEPEAAARVEKLHGGEGKEPLLKGGSAYSDCFTGGAAESHFCSSSMGWGPTFRAANPFVLLAFLISNLYSFIRVGILLVMEIGLAMVDLVRGLVTGYDFIAELKFVPTRVAISILLRELCVIGGKIDLSRGLPVIHINFLGYDEQAHRRGPGSLFAHWSLKGIDDAIARLWRAAHRSPWRNYEVWIYSDHGQAEVRAYDQIHGRSLDEAVTSALRTLDERAPTVTPESPRGIQTQRVRFLGGERMQRLFSVNGINGDTSPDTHATIAALGPVGHVYLPKGMTLSERDAVARELASEYSIPVVLFIVGPGALRARIDTGEFTLPRDCAAVFGDDHPFLDSLGDDLVRLAEHPEAGNLVLLGWRAGISPVTFAEENGAHAGVSPEETNGFALLPADTRLPAREHDYLRPCNLRDAALTHLGRADRGRRRIRRQAYPKQATTLRVMTYNVHSCIGMDGQIDIDRIGRVIARARPDVVALQELDAGRSRTHGLDQAQLIARYLKMEFHFHPAMHLEEERYGDAILTHLPLRLIKAGALPGLADKPRLEPRGALWAAVDLNGQEIYIVNTHLGLQRRERAAQADALLGPEWLSSEECRKPLILCGDFNALPSSAVYRRFAGRLSDVQIEAQSHRPRGTFSSRFPLARIDHIFVSSGLEVTAIEVPNSQLARIASDHLPLVAEVRVDPTR